MGHKPGWVRLRARAIYLAEHKGKEWEESDKNSRILGKKRKGRGKKRGKGKLKMRKGRK